jgi:hypothetical protein
MYLAELCICSESYDFVRETREILGTYSYEICFTRTIDFTVDTSNRFLSSVHKAFTSENILSTAEFVPERDKENYTTVLIFLRV